MIETKRDLRLFTLGVLVGILIALASQLIMPMSLTLK